jgi:hypothetical protein
MIRLFGLKLEPFHRAAVALGRSPRSARHAGRRAAPPCETYAPSAVTHLTRWRRDFSVRCPVTAVRAASPTAGGG